MAAENAVAQDSWGGGKSPFNVSYGKLMMWYFLLSDAFTFSALLISYGAIRFSSPYWADPNEAFSAMPFMGHAKVPLGFVSIMTFILILSSVFVVLAVIEGHRDNKKGVMKWMMGGIIGGIAFLGCQAWEWNHLIHGGNTLWENNYGPQAFGMLFFLITGFHGFHVFSGIVFNIWAFVNTANGEFGRRNNGYEMIEKVGLYWHFVDLVWVFVFLAFYLL
mgnify:CR=1 FL=1